MENRLRVIVGISVTFGFVAGMTALFQSKQIAKQLRVYGDTSTNPNIPKDFEFMCGIFGISTISRITFGIFALLTPTNDESLEIYCRSMAINDIMTILYYIRNRNQITENSYKKTMIFTGLFSLVSIYYGLKTPVIELITLLKQYQNK